MILYIIFFIAIILAFGMLIFRAWEIKTMRVIPQNNIRGLEISFRNIEKNFLYIVRHVVLVVVIVTVKYWLIFITKTKKWVIEKWPKVHNFFHREPKEIVPKKHSFIDQTILESRARISRMKERIKKEHE